MTRAYYAVIILALTGCAKPKPQRVIPPPTPQVRVIHQKLDGCTIKGSVATCHCKPVGEFIDAKDNSKGYICKFHVENPAQ